MKLIEKDAVVTEIKKRKAINEKSYMQAFLNSNDNRDSFGYKVQEDIDILSSIDTLEVKEVDLEIQPSTKIDGWVARQPEGDLWLFSEEPYYNSDIGRWGIAIGDERELENCDTSMFKDLNFFDEPIEVELIIKFKAQKGE